MFYSLLEDSSYQDIHCADQGEDENSVKGSDKVSLVGESGGEEAVEGDTAAVGDGKRAQAGNPSPHHRLCF